MFFRSFIVDSISSKVIFLEHSVQKASLAVLASLIEFRVSEIW